MIASTVTLGRETEPLLALCIHNGHDLPAALETTIGISEADRLREEDPYTEVFAFRFANRLCVHTSRFAVDLNRSPSKAVYLKPEDCWGLPVRKQPLAPELLASLQDDHRQWYELLSYTAIRFLEKHEHLLVLDLHSFNHRRQGPGQPPDPQAQNPDIILGTNNMPDCHLPWVEAVRQTLDGAMLLGKPLDCRINVKFTGGYCSRWLHQCFAGRLTCLAVEFKKTFMDEWTGEVHEHKQQSLAELFAAAVYDTLPQWMNGWRD